jgi:uncharacterized protein YwgA
MTPRDLVLVVIDRCATKGEFGRTSLQKVTYLLSIVLGRDLGYRAHFFGPYSAVVEADTTALVLSGLIEESMQVLGSNAQGWPVRRYTYQVTEEGREALAEVADESKEEVSTVGSWIDQFEGVVGSLDQKVLSAAAKVLYIAREENRAVQIDEIGRLALEHGWTLSTDQVERVAIMLRDLGFARVETVPAPRSS